MRVILAFATGLALASNASAQTVPDRYGPARPVVLAASTAPGAVYGGRMLSWSSKAGLPAPEAPPAVQPPQASQPPQVSQPAPPPAVERRPAQADLMSRAYSLGAVEPTPPAAPLPASLYDAPSPTPAPPQTAAVAAPPRIAAAPAVPARPAPAAPMQMAATPMAAAGGGAPVRLYSLHREYGLTPDPTPQVEAEHYVLVGPPDAPQSNSDSADAAKADDGQDRPF